MERLRQASEGREYRGVMRGAVGAGAVDDADDDVVDDVDVDVVVVGAAVVDAVQLEEVEETADEDDDDSTTRIFSRPGAPIVVSSLDAADGPVDAAVETPAVYLNRSMTGVMLSSVNRTDLFKVRACPLSLAAPVVDVAPAALPRGFFGAGGSMPAVPGAVLGAVLGAAEDAAARAGASEEELEGTKGGAVLAAAGAAASGDDDDEVSDVSDVAAFDSDDDDDADEEDEDEDADVVAALTVSVLGAKTTSVTAIAADKLSVTADVTGVTPDTVTAAPSTSIGTAGMASCTCDESVIDASVFRSSTACDCCCCCCCCC